MTTARRTVILAACGIAAAAFVVSVVFATAMAQVPKQRATLERLLARQTGYDVRFARLQLEFGFYGPELRFSDVTLRRPGETRPLLTAPELVVRFNTWELVRNGTLRPGRIVLRGAEIDLSGLLVRRSDPKHGSRTLGFDREYATASGGTGARPLPAPFDLAAPLERTIGEVLARLEDATPLGSVELENAVFVDSQAAASAGAARIRALHVLLSRGAAQARFSASLLLPARYGRSLSVTANLEHASPGRRAETLLRFNGRDLRPDLWRLAGLEPGVAFAGAIDLSGRLRLSGGRLERADFDGELRELPGRVRSEAGASLRFVAAVTSAEGLWRLRVPNATLRGSGGAERTVGLEFDHAVRSGASSLRARRLSLPMMQRVGELQAGRRGMPSWARVAALRAGALADLALDWRQTSTGFAPSSLSGEARLQGLAIDAGSLAMAEISASLRAGMGVLQIEPDSRRLVQLAWQGPSIEPVRLEARAVGTLQVKFAPEGWQVSADRLQLHREDLTVEVQTRVDLPWDEAALAASAPRAQVVLRAQFAAPLEVGPELDPLRAAALPFAVPPDRLRLERLELEADLSYDDASARWSTTEFVLRPAGAVHGLELRQAEWRPLQRRGTLRLRGSLDQLREATTSAVALAGQADLWQLLPVESRAETVDLQLAADGERLVARLAARSWATPVELDFSPASSAGESVVRAAGGGWRASLLFVRSDAGMWRLGRGGLRLGAGALPTGRPGELRISGSWPRLDAADLPQLLAAAGSPGAGWPEVNATVRVGSLDVNGESFGAARLSGFRRRDGDAGLIFAAPSLVGTVFLPAMKEARNEPARVELSRLRLSSVGTAAALPRAWRSLNRPLELRATAIELGTHRVVRAQARLVPTTQGLTIRDLALDWARLAIRGDGECDMRAERCTLSWRGSSDAPQAWLAELGRAPQLSADALRASGSVAWQPARPSASVEGEIEVAASGGQLRATYDGERSALAAAINPLIAALRAGFAATGGGTPPSRWAFDSLSASATLDAAHLELKALSWTGPEGRLELAGRSEFRPDRIAYRAAWSGSASGLPAAEYRIAGLAAAPSIADP